MPQYYSITQGWQKWDHVVLRLATLEILMRSLISLVDSNKFPPTPTSALLPINVFFQFLFQDVNSAQNCLQNIFADDNVGWFRTQCSDDLLFIAKDVGWFQTRYSTWCSDDALSTADNDVGWFRMRWFRDAVSTVDAKNFSSFWRQWWNTSQSWYWWQRNFFLLAVDVLKWIWVSLIITAKIITDIFEYVQRPSFPCPADTSVSHRHNYLLGSLFSWSPSLFGGFFKLIWIVCLITFRSTFRKRFWVARKMALQNWRSAKLHFFGLPDCLHNQV